MKTDISESFNTILDFLLKWNFPISDFLNDSLSESEVEKLFTHAGLRPTKELIGLYQCKNGTKVDKGTKLDDVQIVPGFHFLSLQDSINSYLVMKNDERWNSSWFPIFANGGGDFYAVDLSQSNDETAPVIGFILGEQDHDVEYQSLTSMLLTFSECFKRNIVFRTEDGYLEMNDEEQAHIASKHNPSVELWQT